MSLDATASLVATPSRRYILQRLSRAGSTHRAELAQEIAEWETAEDSDDQMATVVKQIDTRLYHIHLPLLRDAGVIEYDELSGTVGLAASAKEQ